MGKSKKDRFADGRATPRHDPGALVSHQAADQSPDPEVVHDTPASYEATKVKDLEAVENFRNSFRDFGTPKWRPKLQS